MTQVLLKDQFYNKELVTNLAAELSKYVSVDQANFVKSLIAQFPDLELLARNTACVKAMHQVLPNQYEQAVEILLIVSPQIKGFANIMFSEYVSMYGLDSDISLEALKQLTQYSSSEFAIRHFLRWDLTATLNTMIIWADDKNEHVRRLASEGCRHRLPWSFKLPEIEENPALTLPILDKLKADESEYVRKSVANHLNDSSKTNPSFIISTLSDWDLNHKHTKWIANHAMRTLIKNGNKEALALKGFDKRPEILIDDVQLNKSLITLGESLEFNFEIKSTSTTNQALLIDYVVHYQKQNGSLNPKVFKLKETTLTTDKPLVIKKRHAFKNFTTRKHHGGTHVLEIMVNGISIIKKEFELNITAS